MSFQDATQIDEALRSGSLGLRELYEIWERREPVSDPLAKKAGKSAFVSQSQIRWLQEQASILPAFTAQALEAGEYLLVCDVAREALWIEHAFSKEDRLHLNGLRINYARALARLGESDGALAQLSPLSAADLSTEVRAAGFELRGDLIWERARQQSEPAAQAQVLAEARHAYQDAVTSDPTRFNSHLGLAAVSQLLGAKTESTGVLMQLLRLIELREQVDGLTFASSLARANALVLLGRTQDAVLAYTQLALLADASTSKLADARYEAGLLGEATGQSPELFRGAFPPLQLLVFAGHLPDRSSHQNRFPAARTQAVRESIRAALETLGARAGLSAAAAGGDLLFLDELHRRNAVTHVVLPWSRGGFLETSVRPFDTDGGERETWESLFERALESATSVRELGQMYKPESDISLAYTTEVSAGMALLAAKAARLDVQPVVLWDGQPGGPGGTGEFVSFWRHRLGKEPVIISPFPESQRQSAVNVLIPHRPTERRTMRQEVKTMLFADIVGYSKLTEHVIPEFIEHFLGRVSQIAANTRNRPSSIKTWGDAICAVFDYAADAGDFALKVIQMIRDHHDDWLRLGLYWESVGEHGTVKHPLNIRIGLHTGPVFVHYDPVVNRLDYTGAQVSRAARIEPIARQGEVYASEEFAALMELAAEAAPNLPEGANSEADFSCEYAGTMNLAKD